MTICFSKPTIPTAYQFSPQVRFIKGTGYFAGWISTRDAGQSVYGQVISKTSAPVDTSFRINGQLADVCWDLRMAAARDSGVGCVWADYTSIAQIKYQKISNLGKLSGNNITMQDNSLLGERNFPAIAFRSSGLNVIWTDERNGNPDIFQQRLDISHAYHSRQPYSQRRSSRLAAIHSRYRLVAAGSKCHRLARLSS